MGLKIRPVNLFGLILIIIILLLTANNTVQVSWSDEDCPLEQGYFERLIGDCKQMGGALVCHQTCLARFPNARHATCDYFDDTRSSDKTIPFFCSCCIQYDSNEREAFGEYMPLPRAEWSPSELPPSILTEDFFHPCPESEGLTTRVVADCEIIGKPLCIQTCKETFLDLHSAFCQDRYMEEEKSYVLDCVCCYRAPETPGSEIQPAAETTTGDHTPEGGADDTITTGASEESIEHDDQSQEKSDMLQDDETIQSQEPTDQSKETSTDDASEEATDLVGEKETTDQSDETDRR